MPNDILRAEQRGKAAPKATRRLSLDELQILQAQAASGGVKLQRKLRLPAQDAATGLSPASAHSAGR